MRLFSNRSQMTSKFGNNKKVAHEAMFLPHFDVFYDLLLDNLGYHINLDITLTLREISHINARPCIIVSLSNDPVFNKYLLFAGWEVRIEPRSHFFSTIWTDPKPANNIYFFPAICQWLTSTLVYATLSLNWPGSRTIYKPS